MEKKFKGEGQFVDVHSGIPSVGQRYLALYFTRALAASSTTVHISIDNFNIALHEAIFRAVIQRCRAYSVVASYTMCAGIAPACAKSFEIRQLITGTVTKQG